jgi:hypothetical protein
LDRWYWTILDDTYVPIYPEGLIEIVCEMSSNVPFERSKSCFRWKSEGATTQKWESLHDEVTAFLEIVHIQECPERKVLYYYE